MKKILIGAAMTGIAVTAGIFLLQEYRGYEFRSAIADAEEARFDAQVSEFQRKSKAGMDCLGEQFYLDLIANSINDRKLVQRTAESKCGWIDDNVGIFAASNMTVLYEFELMDVEFRSAEWDRQNQWTAGY